MPHAKQPLRHPVPPTKSSRYLPYLPILIFCAAFLIGLFADLGSLIIWDDEAQLEISRAILRIFGLLPGTPIYTAEDYHFYYAPLWELFLGIMEQFVFSFLHDPILVRHALTFALYPFTLATTFLLLRRAGVHRSTAVLSLACLFGIIRFGGHSLFNIKDLPAATAYLLISLAVWVVLRESAKKGYPNKDLAICGFLSVLPFLLRVPLLLHFFLLLCVLLFIALVTTDRLNFWKRFTMPIAPLVTGVTTIALLYPPFWTVRFLDWLKPFTLFSRFYSWHNYFSVFGEQIHSFSVPWWYPFVWIPTIAHPVVVLSCTIGIFALCVPWLLPRQHVGDSFFLRNGKNVNLSLARWLWTILLLSFAAVLIGKPILYDEERHLLFLYPLLILLGSLGLDWLLPKTKYILAAVIMLVSVFSYVQWGKYSYVYKSPLILNRHADQFMGDYWAVCMGSAVTALKGLVPHEYKVAEEVRHMAWEQEDRLNKSLLYRDPAFGRYDHMYTYIEATPDALSQEKFVMIEYNSRKNPYRFLNYEGRPSRVLWEEKMPPGDTSCAMILFEKR